MESIEQVVWEAPVSNYIVYMDTLELGSRNQGAYPGQPNNKSLIGQDV